METRVKIKKIKDEQIESAIFNLHEYNVNVYSREIFLHSYYHNDSGARFEDEPGMDYRMASAFIKNICLLNQQGDGNIVVHQNSCGGDWNYGMAIYDAIVASKASVIVVAYSHARSMSSITLQAAKLRLLMPSCDFLIHHGHLGMYDRATPVVSNIEFWKKVEMPKMMEIYAERCVEGKFFKTYKKTKKEAINFIARKLEEKSDWILTAEQAVYYGFADGIVGQKKYETIAKIRGKGNV
jgi:ATP-dependent protease ClpP protease subunit